MDTKRKILAALLACILVLGLAAGFVFVKFYRHERWQSTQVVQVQHQAAQNEQTIKRLTDTLAAANEDRNTWHTAIEAANNTIADLEEMIADLHKDVDTLEKLVDPLYSFYQKLNLGLDVEILVVGDSIGAGSGASDERSCWANMLCSWVQEIYGVDCTLTNVSMGGNTSYAGYVRTFMLNDDVSYDLAIICYGQNDGEEGFSAHYEAIIRAIAKKNPNCNVIAVLESSQREYTAKMQEIQKLADYYSIPIADTIAKFKESGLAYEDLTDDGIHPNDAGYKLYFEILRDMIRNMAEENTPSVSMALPAVNMEVTEYDSFDYIAASDFTKVEDCTYEIENGDISGKMGIYVDFVPGENQIKIYVDGSLFYIHSQNWKYDFEQAHIFKLTEDICTVDRTISIEFSTAEQAESFKGLLFTGIP